MGSRLDMEGRALSRLRERLTTELSRKLDQHGLVVWQDEAREYSGVAEQLVPENTLFARYDGSWYELRSAVESALSASEPPRLVIYVPSPSPEEDPLLELRVAGHEFTRRLQTVIWDAMSGEFSEGRIKQLASQAKTIEDVEAAQDGGNEADARLVRILGTTDPRNMALAILSGSHDEQLQVEGAWESVTTFVSERFGIADVAGAGEGLRAAVAQHLILAELAEFGGGLPESLRGAWTAVPIALRRRAIEVLDLWRADPGRVGSYVSAAASVDRSLGLKDRLEWRAGFEKCATVPSVDDVALAQVRELLAHQTWDEAVRIAHGRQRLLWSRADVAAGGWEQRAAQWRTAEAIAELQRLIVRHRPPRGTDLGGLLTWYSESGFAVDRAHRRFELARTELEVHGDLDVPLIAARVAYEKWLDEVLLQTTSNIEESGVETTLQHQGNIHERWVRDAPRPTAYIWVDALRYELGQELADQLRAVASSVEIHPALAALPTITPVGMANLTPGADARLSVGLEGQKLAVRLGDQIVRTPAERFKALRAVHGDQITDKQLDVAARQSEKELHKVAAASSVILIRSQEVDLVGESGMLEVAWPHFAQVVSMLTRVVARLGHAGVRRVVITADHGFIALPRELGAERTIDAPAGGTGELHRRAWVGKGGTTVPSTVRIPLATAGVRSDLHMITPRSLAVFKGGGSKQFFHGGVAPQEMMVPVIIAAFDEAAPAPSLKVRISIAGGHITTGAFAASLEFDGDLFTTALAVRAVAQDAAGAQLVARVVSGDGFDAETGLVTVERGAARILTFQLIRNVERDQELIVEVLDGRTGVRLGHADVRPAVDVVVEEDLS